MFSEAHRDNGVFVWPKASPVEAAHDMAAVAAEG